MKHKLAAKMLSLLLAVVLCATAFAVPAFASGGDESITSTVKTEPTEATDEGTADIQFQIPDELWDMLLPLFGSGDTEEEAETTQTGTVTTNGGKLNVRTGAGLDNYAFTQLPNGTTVEVIGQDGDWYMIRLPEKIGYVYSGYMTLSEDKTVGTISNDISLNFDLNDLSALWALIMGSSEDSTESGGLPLTPDGNLNLIDDMEDAVRAHVIARNPTTGATVPKACHAPKRVLTDEELDTFLAAVQADEVWGDFFYVELTTGLRRGEICGLMWRDFDARNGILQIRRTLHNRKLGADMRGKTKTSSGERTIVLPRSTAELLRRRKETAITQWIFPDPIRPELPLSPHSAYIHLKKILEKAGLPDIRFHDLRHTFATHAIAGGVDAKTLSGILGHTNASFTLDTYTHVTQDMQKAASNIVGGFMENIFGKGLKPWQRDAKAGQAP